MTSTNSSSTSAQTIAGIVIGVVAGTAVVAAACFYLRCWRRSRGKFMRLRKGMRVADPEEEFMSRGPSISFPNRRTGYGHGQQPSVSLEPLLLPSPPQISQDIPVVPIPPDWSYLPPVLPNTPTDPSYLTLYDTEDPFARIQRAILPTSTAHHIPVPAPASSRRVSHELPADQFSIAKTPGSNSPLFINRTLTRPSGPDFFSPRTPTSPFSPADHSHIQSMPSPSRTGNDAVHIFANTNATSPKPQISALSPVTEKPKTKTIPSDIDANSPESIYSQESAQHPSHPPEPQLPTQPQPPQVPRRGRTSQRYSKKLKSPDLSPVLEASSSANGHASGNGGDVSELDKKPSRTFSELDRSSSLSVALSHSAASTNPECTSTLLPLPLLSSNAFGKTSSGSGSGSSASTLSPASSRATRYPSLANSTSTPSSSGSNPHPHPHSNSATEWNRPPAGLGALKHLQLDLPNPGLDVPHLHLDLPLPNLHLDLPNPHSDLPNPHSDLPNPHSDLPNPHSDLPNPHSHAPALPQLPLIADKREEPPNTKARLCAHSPGSVPEVEHRSTPIVQCAIASIDVSL